MPHWPVTSLPRVWVPSLSFVFFQHNFFQHNYLAEFFFSTLHLDLPIRGLDLSFYSIKLFFGGSLWNFLHKLSWNQPFHFQRSSSAVWNLSVTNLFLNRGLFRMHQKNMMAQKCKRTWSFLFRVPVQRVENERELKCVFESWIMKGYWIMRAFFPPTAWKEAHFSSCAQKECCLVTLHFTVFYICFALLPCHVCISLFNDGNILPYLAAFRLKFLWCFHDLILGFDFFLSMHSYFIHSWVKWWSSYNQSWCPVHNWRPHLRPHLLCSKRPPSKSPPRCL